MANYADPARAKPYRRCVLEAKVRRLRLAGQATSEIAAAVGRCRAYIVRVVNRLGLPGTSEAARIRAQRAAQKARRELFGPRKSASERLALETGWPVGSADQARDLAALEAGADTPAKLAAATGLSLRLVRLRLWRLMEAGLVTRTRRGAVRTYRPAPWLADYRERWKAEQKAA